MGQFEHNARQGKGKIDYANGEKYIGDWITDIRTGKGVYICANGDRYEMDCL